MGPGGKLNFILDVAGNLDIDGTLTQSSDRNRKTAFEDADSEDILDRLRRIPIQTWRYKDDPGNIRHIGPVSQDFHSEFNVGKDNKTIATVDADGVALAAIQALAAKMDDVVDEKDRRIGDLQERIEQLESMLQEQQSILREMQNHPMR